MLFIGRVVVGRSVNAQLKTEPSGEPPAFADVASKEKGSRQIRRATLHPTGIFLQRQRGVKRTWVHDLGTSWGVRASAQLGASCSVAGYELGTSFRVTGLRAAAPRFGYELQRSWVITGYELGTNWIRTGYELDTNWIRAANGPSKSAATTPILNRRGQSGESASGKTKEGPYRGFEGRQCRDRSRRTGHEAPSSFPGLVAGSGHLSAAEAPLVSTKRRVSC